MLRFLLFLFHVTLFFVTGCGKSNSHLLSIPTSNKTQKNNVTQFLLQKYEESQVLVLAFANHENHSVYHHLKPLLAELQDDPRLKTVVLERSQDISAVYQQLSTSNTDEVISKYPFVSEDSRQMTLCGSSEWSYSIAEFMPIVRQVNKKRSKAGLSNISIKTVDSVDSRKSFIWPMKVEDLANWPDNVNEFVKEDQCNFSATFLGEQPMWVYSDNRERQTATNFHKEIWQNIKPDEKVIIAYHMLHTTPGFDRCGLFMKSERDWVARRNKITWYDYFLEQIPDAESKFSRVLLDETAETHPNGVLNITKEIVDNMDQASDFAFDVNDISTDLLGTKLFLPDFFETIHDVRSNLALKDMFKGVIWTADADKRFPTKTAHDYLPGYCSEDTNK